MNKLFITAMLLILASPISKADIFKCFNEDGRIYYLDNYEKLLSSCKGDIPTPIIRTRTMSKVNIDKSIAKRNVSKVAHKKPVDMEKIHERIDEFMESFLKKAFLPSENGHFTGIHEGHDKQGNKDSEVTYKDGKPNGLAIWWDSDKRKSRERHYINGELNGIDTSFFYDSEADSNGEWKGDWKSETNYKNGKRDGLEIWWHANGRKSAEKHYTNGKLNGLSTFWHESGKIDFIEDYKDGIEIPLVNTAISNIKNRCQTQMGEHGAAMVKACVDQDIEALHEIQNNSYKIIPDCTGLWGVVKFDM